ncbi:MAG: hypothetical protein ACON5D_09340 [Rubripirellula sp.]
MAKRRNNTPSPVIKAIIAYGTLLVGVLVALAFYQLNTPEPVVSREGLVAVPKSLNQLKAFEKVGREDVSSSKFGDDSYFWLSPEEVNPEWVVDVSEIIGRVLRSDKRPGFVFQKKDFLPEGSRSGIAGGIPEGKQGFFLQSDDVPGLRFLRKGDRFDLLANVQSTEGAKQTEYGLLMGGVKVLAGKPIPLNGVRILVQDAQVIALTTNSSITTQGGLKWDDAAAQGRNANSTGNERVAIAIDPEEAIPLTQALGDDLEIHMVTRSGQKPDADGPTDQLAGYIGIASNAIRIEPFQAIQASDLSEPDSGQLRQYYFKSDELNPDWIQDPKQLIGRVVNREIEPGYLFSESDFLQPGTLITSIKAYEAIDEGEFIPADSGSDWTGRVAARDLKAGETLNEDDLFPAGTSPGVTAAIPSDRLALEIEVDQVRGANQLARGDRFDLLCTVTSDIGNALAGVQVSPVLLSNLENARSNRLLAKRAIVIERIEDQIIVAFHANEISEITKSLASNEDIYCITRSANDDDAEETAPSDRTTQWESDPNPLDGISVSETIIAGERVLRAYGDSK